VYRGSHDTNLILQQIISVLPFYYLIEHVKIIVSCLKEV
jgi:hypothetical protein